MSIKEEQSGNIAAGLGAGKVSAKLSRRELLIGSTQIAASILAAGALAAGAGGQTHPAVSGHDKRIKPITWYEFDMTWPQRPFKFRWGQVPAVAVDRYDRVWVFARSEPPVQVYDSQGKFLYAWGEKMFKKPHFLKIDHEGNVWTSDWLGHVVRKFTAEGKLLLTLGTANESGNDESHFNQPTDMAITPSGEIFVSDGYGNKRIVHFDSNGRFIKAWGKKGIGPGEFGLPHAIAIDSKGRLYVADRSNARIQIFDQSGNFLDEWTNIVVPWGLWITGSDEVWVCGSSARWWQGRDKGYVQLEDQLFMRFNSEGKLQRLRTVPKGDEERRRPGELNGVHGIAVDSKGNVYLAEVFGKRVQRFARRTNG